jgi:hypothetical protein
MEGKVPDLDYSCLATTQCRAIFHLLPVVGHSAWGGRLNARKPRPSVHPGTAAVPQADMQTTNLGDGSSNLSGRASKHLLLMTKAVPGHIEA